VSGRFSWPQLGLKPDIAALDGLLSTSAIAKSCLFNA
jgi:hypothetical protein